MKVLFCAVRQTSYDAHRHCWLAQQCLCGLSRLPLLDNPVMTPIFQRVASRSYSIRTLTRSCRRVFLAGLVLDQIADILAFELFLPPAFFAIAGIQLLLFRRPRVALQIIAAVGY